MTEAQVTRQEWDLLKAIRESSSSEFKLSVRRDGDVWTIDVDQWPHDDRSKLHGSGLSFSAAWSSMTTLAVEPISPLPSPRR
jgi:hypothetical protein